MPDKCSDDHKRMCGALQCWDGSRKFEFLFNESFESVIFDQCLIC